MHLELKRPTALVIRSLSTNPYLNCAFEDWVLKQSCEEKRILLLWRNDKSIILGRHQNPWRECNLSLAREKNIKVVRRFSGGGAVYHDLGNCNYSFMCDKQSFSRTHALDLIIEAFKGDLHLEKSPFHDLYLKDKKVSGSAYRLLRTRSYHHGTFLVSADLHNLNGVLRPQVPESCFAADVSLPSRRAPVANIQETQHDFTTERFFSTLTRLFSESFKSAYITLDEPQLLAIPEVCESFKEISAPEWILGKTPTFKVSLPDKILTIAAGKLAEIEHIDANASNIIEYKPPTDTYFSFSDIRIN